MRKRWCEDTEGRQPSARQGERPPEKLNLPAPWSWTCSLQTVRKSSSVIESAHCLDYYDKDNMTGVYWTSPGGR